MKDRYLALLRLFCEHHGAEAQRIAEMISRGEWSQARQAAHSINGAAGTFGGEGVEETAAAIESRLLEESVGIAALELAGLVDELDTRLDALVEALDGRP
jgi:HPt (histidine-containing phosphotransfer) domain-containing protein